MSEKITYRGEIDGLRALAVSAVLFYHAEFMLAGENYFQGGYLGVDIFLLLVAT